jgi:hypothetical protein
MACSYYRYEIIEYLTEECVIPILILVKVLALQIEILLLGI